MVYVDEAGVSEDDTLAAWLQRGLDFARSSLNKAALRSLFELRDIPNQRPGRPPHRPNRPRGVAANRWIKTSPGEGWFAYLRIYGPEAPAFDGTWRLPDFEPID